MATNKRKPVRQAQGGPKRARRYGRVSTSEQNETGAVSIPDQDTITAAHCERRGWLDGGFAFDEETGTDNDRKHWQELMADCRAGEVDVIVCAKLDRFSRSAREGLNQIHELKQVGVDVVVCDIELDTTTPNGKAMQAMLLVWAQLERDTIIDRMARGAHAKARDGRWPSSPQGAPFGLRVEGAKREARLVLHEQESETIRTAARLILDEGRTLAETCALLNSLGMLPRGGLRKLDGQTVPIPAMWGMHLLRRHLTRPALVGEVYWGTGRTSTGNYGGVQIRDVPAVLTRERWEALREAITVHGPAPEYGMAYPLSGRVVSLCGKRYNGIYRSDRDLRSYKCQGKRGEHGIPACGCPWYDADPLEARVWGVVCELLGDAGRLTQLAREYLAIESGRAVTQADELAALHEQIAKLEAQLSAGVTAYLRAGIDPDAMAAATKGLQDEMALLRRRRDDIERYQSDTTAQAGAMDQVAKLAQRAAGRLASMNGAQRAEVIRLLDIEVQPLETGRTPALRIRGIVCDSALASDPADRDACAIEV